MQDLLCPNDWISLCHHNAIQAQYKKHAGFIQVINEIERMNN